MRGENTKSEQVLPILLDCISIIIAYNIKPEFVHISSEEMWFADPLSRLTQPGHEQHYKKLFKARNSRFRKRNVPWKPTESKPVQNTKALDIPKLWHSLLDV